MAIADYLRKLIELKNQLVVNLRNKGVTADESEKLNTLVPKVLDIETGVDTTDATATASDILKGKTAYVNDVKVTGTIASKSATTYTPGTTNKTISSGVYLSGTQTIKGDSNLKAANIKKGVSIFGVSGTLQEGIDTTDATATAEDIVLGKTAYVNGQKLTGTKEPVEQSAEFDESFKIISANIPDSVTSIGDYAFYNCTNLTSIIIPDSVTSIGLHVFSGCTNLSDITIGKGVMKIMNYAFKDCSSLESIIIGNSGVNIQGYAFYNCTNLTSVTIPGSCSTTSTTFEGCSIKTLIIADGSITINYSATTYLRQQVKEVIISDSVTSIGNQAFKEYTNLTSINIPNSVTSIGNDAFWICTNLTSIIIPDSVTSIGDYAFASCEKLAHIYYTGSQTQWSAITKGFKWDVGMGTSVSGGTTIHYNYVP